MYMAGHRIRVSVFETVEFLSHVLQFRFVGGWVLLRWVQCVRRRIVGFVLSSVHCRNDRVRFDGAMEN